MTTTSTLNSELILVHVAEITADYISGKSGLDVGKKIDEVILKHLNQVVTVSLNGVEHVSPSFVNGAFLYLIELYGEDYFKKYIKIRQANTKVAALVKESVQRFLAHRQSFFQKLQTNKIFALTDGSVESQKVLAGLLSTGTRHFTFLHGEQLQKVASFDCGIALMASTQVSDAFMHALEQAVRAQKPVLLLLKKQLHFLTKQIRIHIYQKIVWLYRSCPARASWRHRRGGWSF